MTRNLTSFWQKKRDSLLRQSRGAASFDAVISLALAYDEMIRDNKFVLQQDNYSQILNKTLSSLKYSGLAVSSLLSIKITIHYAFFTGRNSITLNGLLKSNSVFLCHNLMVTVNLLSSLNI